MVSDFLLSNPAQTSGSTTYCYSCFCWWQLLNRKTRTDLEAFYGVLGCFRANWYILLIMTENLFEFTVVHGGFFFLLQDIGNAAVVARCRDMRGTTT